MADSTPSGIVRPCPYCKVDLEAPVYAVESDGSETIWCATCENSVLVHVTTVVKVAYRKKPKRDPDDWMNGNPLANLPNVNPRGGK